MSEVFKMNELDDVKIEKIKNYIDEIDDKKRNIIKILHYAQEVYGYLPKELQLYIARKVNLPASKINGIVTFYSFFTEKAIGKYEVSVCMGTACYVKDSKTILEEFENQLDIGDDGISKNGLFSLNSVRCIGACGLGPVIKINDKIIGHVKKDMVKGIIEDIVNSERGVKKA